MNFFKMTAAVLMIAEIVCTGCGGNTSTAVWEGGSRGNIDADFSMGGVGEAAIKWSAGATSKRRTYLSGLTLRRLPYWLLQRTCA